MAKAAAVPRQTGQKWLMAIGRQRELSLLAIMFVLGAGVSMLAPQFLTVNNISQVAALAAVVAVAAVGEAFVIITRGIDLSIEARVATWLKLATERNCGAMSETPAPATTMIATRVSSRCRPIAISHR